MAFILTEILIFLILCGLFLVLSAVWPPDSPWAPWWQMPDDVIRSMYKIARLTKDDVVYDLGCGTGKALVFAAKRYGVKGVGIEIDPLRAMVARWNIKKGTGYWFMAHSKDTRQPSLRAKRSNLNITILKDNFFNVPLSDASVVVVYLIPAALKRLAPKLFKELRPGTRLISYIYDFPSESYAGRIQLINYDTEKRIYVYKLLGKAK